MVDIIDFDMITKVEIWLTDDCVTLTGNEDIRKFTDIQHKDKAVAITRRRQGSNWRRRARWIML